MKLPKKKDFFCKYNIKDSEYRKAAISWKDLEAVFKDYKKNCDDLCQVAAFISNQIAQRERVHSTRFRVKKPEHLIEKIIRKKIEDNTREITVENYRQEITDLVGIRALHLFKNDWEPIHRAIQKSWDLLELPKAYIRKGDSSEIVKMYEREGCEVKEHPYGYRSVHYVVKSSFTKELETSAEIQVRTVFEEGWSEVDHTLRYPYEISNPILTKYLSIQCH